MEADDIRRRLRLARHLRRLEGEGSLEQIDLWPGASEGAALFDYDKLAGEFALFAEQISSACVGHTDAGAFLALLVNLANVTRLLLRQRRNNELEELLSAIDAAAPGVLELVDDSMVLKPFEEEPR